MTKSYCSLQQFEVSSVGSTTDEFLQTPHHPSFLQQLVDVFDREMSSFLFQAALPSLWKFVDAHQPVPPDVVDINESLRVFVWSVRVPFSEIMSCSIRLGDVDLFLITFNSKLKIFDSPLNNQTSGIILSGLCLGSRRRVRHSRDSSLKILEIIVDEEFKWYSLTFSTLDQRKGFGKIKWIVIATTTK
ncbi:hypothetical protein Tco_0582029 [Tanacetum coccineum]